mgnify:CR=1 FL=1
MLELSEPKNPSRRAGLLPMSVVAATSRTAHGTGIDGAVAQVTAPSVEKTFVGAIDGFDIKSELGPKGVRTLDRATGLALAAISDLAKDANALHKLSDLQDEASLILGTSYGSLSSTCLLYTSDAADE